MATSANLRCAERLCNSDIAACGFVIRKRLPVATLSALFMAISLGVVGVAGVWFYDVHTAFYLCLGTGGVAACLAMHLDRMQKSQPSTEFLSALLSLALGHNFRFSMIVRSDGEIVYLNRAFQSMFPRFVAQSAVNLTMLCNMQSVPPVDQQQLVALVTQAAAGRVSIVINVGAQEQSESILLHIEPIDFSPGYALIRGV